MSVLLTDREQAYLDCETPMISGSSAALRLTAGVIAAFFRAIVAPSSEYNKTDSKMIRTVREMRYTKYKKAVLRKRDSTPKKGDERLLAKINRIPFVLEEDAYDPDKFVEEIYAEYMKNHTENEDCHESK